MYCPNGNEEKMIASCKAHIKKEILQDAFTLTCSRMKRYQGEWHKESYPLFPNYVFLESDCERELSRELKPYRSFVSVLEQEGNLVAIQPEEEQFLHGLCGEDRHIEMSRGFIRDGKTFVTEGPLVGHEMWIRHIDRHKRLAKLELPMHSMQQPISVGLEIFAKEETR